MKQAEHRIELVEYTPHKTALEYFTDSLGWLGNWPMVYAGESCFSRRQFEFELYMLV